MLREREKLMVVAGGVAAALILVVTLFVVPEAARVRSLSRQFAAAEKDLAELRKVRPELERADRAVRQASARVSAGANAPDPPLARLTAALQEAGFPSSAVSLKSGGARDGEFFREEAFDLRIENLTYLEAAKLVSKLEAGPLPVVIRSAQLKSRYDDSKYVDATLRVGFLLPLAK